MITFASKMGRILAIDYGGKRCGVAVTDPLRIIANAVETVPTSTIFEFLDKYFTANEVDIIVVGKPVQMNGQPSQSWESILIFAQNFEQKYPNIPIKFHDERFTSKMASQAIALSGMPKYKRQSKELIDKTSAVIILQSYLNSFQNQ